MAFALCRELGIRLIFGFPNQNSYHGAVHTLGWKMTETMDCFLIPVNTLPLSTLARQPGILQKLYKRYRQWVLKKYPVPGKGLVNSVITDGFAGVCRKEPYHEYKQFCQAQVIGAGGSKIWISDKPGLLIGDMEDVDETNFLPVIKKLKGIAVKLGARQIQFHTSPGTRLHSLFAARYKAIPSYPVLFQDFGSAIPPSAIKFTFADLDIF
jgi:hypothetical protein